MAVRESIPVERPCGVCGETFTPVVLTWPDIERDKCETCSTAFISKFIKVKGDSHE